MLRVSYFAKAAHHQNAVAITNSVPMWYKGRVYKKLAPPAWAVFTAREGKLSDEEFTEVYRRYLDTLNWDEVFSELPEDAVLLCYEAPYQFCHRHVLAEYLLERFGLVVPEFGVCDPNNPEPAHITHRRLKEMRERALAEKEAARAAREAKRAAKEQARQEKEESAARQLRFF